MKGRSLLRYGARAVALTVLALVLVTASAHAAPLSAASVTQYLTQGNEVQWSGYAATSCGYSGASIDAFSSVKLASDSSPYQPHVSVSYYAVDYCAGTYFFGSMDVPMLLAPNAFIASNGASASLSPTLVVVRDTFAHTGKLLIVSGTWSGDPATTTHTRYSQVYGQPGLTIHEQGTGTITTAATAITMLEGSTNIAPSDIQRGDILTSMSGSLSISH